MAASRRGWRASATTARRWGCGLLRRPHRGFILYPGKLTGIETFRVGCIGAIGRAEMLQAVQAVGDALREIGVLPG